MKAGIRNFIQNLLCDSINVKVGDCTVVENESLTLKSLIRSCHDFYEVTIIKAHALQERKTVTGETIYSTTEGADPSLGDTIDDQKENNTRP